MNKKAIIALLVLAVIGPIAITASGDDGKKLVISVGRTVSSAEATDLHNVSLASLKQGQDEYAIKGHEVEHKFKLTEAQIKEILDGTTVHVATRTGGLKVQLTVEDAAPKKSGW